MASEDKNDDILRKNIKEKVNSRNREVTVHSISENVENVISPEIDDTDESLQFLNDLGISDVQGDLSKNKNYDEISTLLTKKQKDTINKKLSTLRSKRATRADIREYFGPTTESTNLNIPLPDYLSSDEDESKSSSEHLNLLNQTIDKLPDDVTYIYGLPPKVLQDLRVIARIEIDELFEKHSIKWVRYKPRRGKDSGIFNVSLVNLLNNDLKKDPNLRVPLFYLRLFEKLDTNCDEEGILRIPGSVSRIREMRNELDSSRKTQMETIIKDATIADLSGLLKLFLKDLPSSLLTHQFMDAYPNVLKISEKNEMIYAFQLLNLLLPDVHRACFQLLMRLLHRVINNSQNKMTLENVATLMGPNLFVSSKSKSSDFELFGHAVQVINQMLRIDEYLWVIPSKLIAQIRKKYQKKLKAQVKNVVKLGEDVAYSFQFLTIDIDTQPRHQISIEINMTSTVANVLDKISRHESFMKSDDKKRLKNLRLFELGGNINYRLLSKSTNIHSVKVANPTASFYASIYSTHKLVTRWPKTFEPVKS